MGNPLWKNILVKFITKKPPGPEKGTSIQKFQRTIQMLNTYAWHFINSLLAGLKENTYTWFGKPVFRPFIRIDVAFRAYINLTELRSNRNKKLLAIP